MPRKPLPLRIEPINPPEKAVLVQEYPTTKLNQKQAIIISQKLRITYVKYLGVVNFGEMENAVLTHNYEAHRNLAIVDKKIVGAIAFHFDEASSTIYIDHIGTLMAPKGTGAELMRTAVDGATKSGVGISLESTPNAYKFWLRLGFKHNKEVPYIFEADVKRTAQINEALGVIGRVEGKK